MKLMNSAIDSLVFGQFLPMMKLVLPIAYHRANAMVTGSLQSTVAWNVVVIFCFDT